VFEEAVGQ
jgi:hypothetical protein